jgi:hypothetical protein
MNPKFLRHSCGWLSALEPFLCGPNPLIERFGATGRATGAMGGNGDRQRGQATGTGNGDRQRGQTGRYPPRYAEGDRSVPTGRNNLAAFAGGVPPRPLTSFYDSGTTN